MLNDDNPNFIILRDRKAHAPNGRSVTLTEIALDTLHRNDQKQIMGVASYVSPSSPPPFAAQFAEVTVDTATGAVTVDKLVMAVDSGVHRESADRLGSDRGRDDASPRLRGLRGDALR